MSTFVQIHALTFYPPSNLNRDDLGKPKSAMMGGTPRLRISSQCLKRSWRTSDVFQRSLKDNIGTRTKRIRRSLVEPILKEAKIEDKDIAEWSKAIVESFVENADKSTGEIPQVIHLFPRQVSGIRELAHKIASRKSGPEVYELEALHSDEKAVDIALFGRMIADHPKKATYPKRNVNAAAQVAHAITVNKVAIEDDFFTAVDDLNPAEETGAGHVDEHWFGSGTFYLYVCVNRDLLIENLGGDETLANQTLRALTEAIATVSPSGKQNSFAALARASYIRAERGSATPRSLALAFAKAQDNADMGTVIKQLEDTRKAVDEAYEAQPEEEFCFQPGKGTTLSQLLDFVARS